MSESVLYTAVATDSTSSVSDDIVDMPPATGPADRLATSAIESDRMGVAFRMKRNWQVFPGRNRFCCDGRVMMSHEAGVFYLTVILIVGTSCLFFGFDCPYLVVVLSPVIPAIDGLLFIFIMATLFRTSFTDPGVLPRATADEAAYTEQQIETAPDANGTSTYRPPPRTQDIQIRGQVTKIKYCFTCKIFRPPRASHCSVCDNCVERFDHHCPWVGNCVGQRNYRYFYLFLVSLSLHALYIFIFSLAHLIMISRTSDFITAVQTSPASVVVCVICFFSVWSVVGLSGFHTYLTVSSQTTNEDIKGTYSSHYGSQPVLNPFSQGNIFVNFCATICGPVYPSVIGRRGYVVPPSDTTQKSTNSLQNYGTTDNRAVSAACNMQQPDTTTAIPAPAAAAAAAAEAGVNGSGEGSVGAEHVSS